MKNKIKLYHYSDNKIKAISPKYFGDNLYTLNDKKSSSVKRSFYYLKNNPIEYRFKGCRYVYIIEVSKNKLYDLRADRQKLIEKYPESITQLLNAIKRRGYIGIIYNIGFDIACLFKNAKVKKAIVRF